MSNTITHNLLDITYLDGLARQNTWLHRIDPRTKLIVTSVYLALIASFDKHTISALLAFSLYPVVLITAGRLSLRFVLNKLLLLAPFVLLIALANPLIDHRPFCYVGDWPISRGWISFLSILLRFCLTITTVLGLIAVTGFNPLCSALGRLGVPRPFVLQLMFVYRYLFVLGEEAGRMVRAQSLRSWCQPSMSIRVFGSLTGHLFLRTLDRAERLYQGMLCRGFAGDLRMMRNMRFTFHDFIYAIGWLVILGTFRLFNISQHIGSFVTGGWR